MRSYKISIYIYEKGVDCDPLELFLEGNDALKLKADVLPAIQKNCQEDGLKDIVWVEVNMETSDGEYYDSDEFEFNVTSGKIVF